jgi:hypothetical protein
MNSVAKFENRVSSSQARKKGNPRNLYATGSAGLATLVRGSSRRITIMRFRPANIRLINRRSNLPRLLLALSSKSIKCNGNDKYNPTNSQRLTRSLHFRDLSTIDESESKRGPS